MGSSKEYAKAYNKAYYEKNKEKEKLRAAAYKEANRSIINTKQREHYHNNKEAIAARKKGINESKGVGVYKAIYPSGIYIGSGQIHSRGPQHLTGNTTIAKTLKEKATSFEVICLTKDIEEARIKEQETVDWYGLSNLLNTKNPKLGE